MDQLADDIRKTDEQLTALKQTLNQNTQLKESLQNTFAATRNQRGEREERLQELDTQIDLYSQRLDELEITINSASNDIQRHKFTLAQALKSAQSMGKHSELKALLHHSDPVAAQRLSTYREYLFSAQSRQLGKAIDFLEQVEQARLSTLKDRNWLVHIKSKATDQRNAFAQSEESTRKEIDSLQGKLEQTTQSVAKLEQDQLRLQSLMDELESLQRPGSGYFDAFKGQFAMPVQGTIGAHFGTSKSVGKLSWEGLYINAPVGRAVLAVADGEVVYSDWLQGFGMLVIIDHGDSYMTLYGGNREVMARVGSWVSSGTTIASVGDSGGQNSSGLYFEIRHNARALDPLQWLSAEAIESAANQM